MSAGSLHIASAQDGSGPEEERSLLRPWQRNTATALCPWWGRLPHWDLRKRPGRDAESAKSGLTRTPTGRRETQRFRRRRRFWQLCRFPPPSSAAKGKQCIAAKEEKS